LVLVYPGSDLDTWRPFRHRNRIELGGRTGFLKLALRERVPIVPVVSAGTSEQMVVLLRGERVARALGLKRLLRAEACPIMLALPWGITSGYLPYVPLPAQTTLRFGSPIRFAHVDPAQAEDPHTLERCYDEVRAQMQALLDSVTEGRRWLRGQPRR
jgi:1-acyl-sn-glycerol-3-phosphate acyltransferase